MGFRVLPRVASEPAKKKHMIPWKGNVGITSFYFLFIFFGGVLSKQGFIYSACSDMISCKVAAPKGRGMVEKAEHFKDKP